MMIVIGKRYLLILKNIYNLLYPVIFIKDSLLDKVKHILIYIIQLLFSLNTVYIRQLQNRHILIEIIMICTIFCVHRS